jgi:hypothetical protein
LELGDELLESIMLLMLPRPLTPSPLKPIQPICFCISSKSSTTARGEQGESNGDGSEFDGVDDNDEVLVSVAAVVMSSRGGEARAAVEDNIEGEVFSIFSAEDDTARTKPVPLPPGR